MVLPWWFTVVPILLLLVRDGMLAGLTRDYAPSGHEERGIIMTLFRDSMLPVEENIVTIRLHARIPRIRYHSSKCGNSPKRLFSDATLSFSFLVCDARSRRFTSPESLVCSHDHLKHPNYSNKHFSCNR